VSARSSPALRAVAGLPAIGLGVLVAAWWLLIAAAVAPLLPSPGARLLPGYRAHIAQQGMRDWPLPTSRLAFDTFQRGYAAVDEEAQAEAFARATRGRRPP
jgi:hypothetical protein